MAVNASGKISLHAFCDQLRLERIHNCCDHWQLAELRSAWTARGRLIPTQAGYSNAEFALERFSVGTEIVNATSAD